MIGASILLSLGDIAGTTNSIDAFGIAFFLPDIGSLAASFLAIAIGSVVARRQFLSTAMSFVLVVWLLLIYLAHQIAIPAGRPGYLEVAFSNLPGLIAYLAAAALGVVVGQWYYQREFRGESDGH